MNKIIQNHQDFEKYAEENKIDQKKLNNYFESHFTVKSPQAYLDQIDWQNDNDPLKLMVIPNTLETEIKEYEVTDPIGDQPHLATKNLVHRYPDRVLLLLTNNCQINCRFCFRRELTHHSTPPNLEDIYNYLKSHTAINEVIFSGGDPLTLSAKYLTIVFEKLKTIPHIKKYRFHTRIPIVNPSHITQQYLDFFDLISKEKQLTIVLHVNHVQEITNANIEICKKLRKSALLLSQTVLLKNVNDNKETLVELFNKLITLNIKPYYLHHLDQVKGTDYFRISIAEGKRIYQSIQGELSGPAIPRYVLDLPGGKGKVPVMWLEEVTSKNKAKKEVSKKSYQVKNFKGETITYEDPAGFPTSQQYQK
jgi:lysine 2,3-aminomutase